MLQKCNACDGSGMVVMSYWANPKSEKCPACDGAGQRRICNTKCPHFVARESAENLETPRCGHPLVHSGFVLVAWPPEGGNRPEPWCPLLGDSARITWPCEWCGYAFDPIEAQRRALHRKDASGKWRQYPQQPLEDFKRCYTCAHFSEAGARAESVVIHHGRPEERVMYTIGREPTERELADSGKRSCLGFGGSKFRIRLGDGTLVVTHNLWSAGPIPRRIWSRFPPNAEMLK